MLKYLALGLISFLSLAGLSGQGTLLKEANLFYEARQFDKALNAYTIYNRNNPGNDLVLTHLGICNYHSGNSQKAIQSLKALLSSAKKPETDAYLYLAKSYHAEGQFKLASDAYKVYLGKIKLDDAIRKHVRDAIKRCGSGIRLKATKADAIVENIGNIINSNYDDYGAVLSPTYSDRIYFSSVRPSNHGGMRNAQNKLDPKYGRYASDVYSASIVNGSWDNVQSLGGNLNSIKDDQVLDFSSDGQSLLLWKSVNGYSGNVIVDTFSNDGKVRRGLFPAPISGKQGDGGLFYYNDTTILFYSNRPGGFGGMDLYAAFQNNEGWTKAFNLGPDINSTYDEVSPFLSADGSTLYFASNRLESIGGFDVFKSTFEVGRHQWGQPSNLGAPINSGRDDFQLRLDSRGLQGYLTSNRPNGQGQLDIYVVYFKNYLSEQQTDNIIASLGLLVESHNQESIVSETVTYDESQIKKYNLRPIYYDNDDRIITPDNLSSLDEAVSILRDNPSVMVEVIGSSDKSASVEFDLYFSIKRAEEVANYIVQKGIAQNRIISRGAGQSFPIVRHEINDQPVLIAKRINRRIEFIFQNTEGLPIEIISEQPSAKNPSFEMPGIQRLTTQSKGISYRVKVAMTSNMYNGNIISNYPDPMIDKPLDRNLYRYTIGMYGTYQSAQFMKQDLIKQGVTEAEVIPFFNGRELDKNAALALVDDHPDLVNYLVNE